MVEGVTKGFEKHLEIQGVGYRAQLKGAELELSVGFSHPVTITPREGVSFDVPAADAGDRQGHGQAGRRADGRRDPQGAPARALQGQGHPLPGRARAEEGREARMSMSVREARLRRHRRVRGKVSGHGRAAAARRLPLEQRASSPSSSTTRPGARSPPRAGSRQRSFKGTKTEQAAAVGKALAAEAKKAGIETCVFDRGGYLYHGRVKALAEGAREGGLRF